MAAAAGTLDLLGGLGRPYSQAPPQLPPSSQLTIFYSGTVNVYDDVPEDKAHAIMLLLANGDDKRVHALDAGIVHSNANVGASVSTNGGSMTSRPSISISAMFKPPFTASTGNMVPFTVSTPPPQSPCPAPLPERKQQPILGKRTQAELPFARKASLARFLEKRKDRVHAKLNASGEEADGGESSKRFKLNNDGMAPSQ